MENRYQLSVNQFYASDAPFWLRHIVENPTLTRYMRGDAGSEQSQYSDMDMDVECSGVERCGSVGWNMSCPMYRTRMMRMIGCMVSGWNSQVITNHQQSSSIIINHHQACDTETLHRDCGSASYCAIRYSNPLLILNNGVLLRNTIGTERRYVVVERMDCS